MAGTTYQQLMDAVAQYYGSGSDEWLKIAQNGVTQESLPIIQQVPGVTVTLSKSGQYLGYDYNNPFCGAPDPVSSIDSNVQTGMYGAGSFNAQLPATVVTDQSTGIATMHSGSKLAATGATIATLADRANLALVGVSLGTKLGKFIDSALYNVSPSWWDEHYPTINPETWDDIATTQGGKDVIRSIFGLENDDTTMYLDERLLAYTYMMLLQNGAWDSGGKTITVDNPVVVKGKTYQVNTTPVYATPLFTAQQNSEQQPELHTATGNWEICFATVNSTEITWHFISKNPLTVTSTLNLPASSPQNLNITQTYFTDEQHPIYFVTAVRSYFRNFVDGSVVIPPQIHSSGADLTDIISIPAGSSEYQTKLALYHILLYQSTVTDNPSTPGISTNSEASTQITPSTLINPITGQPVTPNDDPADVLQALKTQYPTLFTDSIYQDIPQPDGSTKRITYLPTPYPDTTNPTKPITDDTTGIDPQTDPEVNPDTRTQDLIKQIIDNLTSDPTPPDTGDGSTPAPVIPAGSANALYAIYNPTQAELNSFGGWLWSSNFVDQLLKLFNDPMQAIIGLHKVFAAPSISGQSTIKVGYLDSGVSSNVVGNQYTTINCGSVRVREYFGNVFDYDPFTQIYIYLPFVGIEKLDTGDVMRGQVGVKYHVDVLTGACLAEISVTRDGSGGILYTFTGNCAVQYPISSGSYMGIIASMASIAGGVVGTVISGGALAPVAMGAVSGVLNAHTRVQHSGGFSGNAGAMGVKKPYLIITRPQTCLANEFPKFNGYPANKTTTLSTCTGFVKCESCHVENIPATEAELAEIEALLATGILI